MEIIEKSENQMTFKGKINESLANAIRRYLNQILVLAIDEVEIYKNDSPLYDETIAHRMGLIPIKTDKAVKKDSEMDMKLDVKGPGFVYSGDISGDPGVVYKGIPITHLNEGLELQIVSTVRPGKGVTHSKFSPGLLFYRDVLEISVDEDLQEEIKKVCPENDIKKEGKKIKIIDDRKKEVSDVCEQIVKEKGKSLEITPKEELVISIESFGQMDVKDIFKNSIKALKKDLSEISKKLK